MRPAALALSTRIQRPVLATIAALCLAAVSVLPANAASTPPSTPPSPAPAAGGIGLRLLDAPVSARDDPRARVYIVDHLPPGEVIERRIEVSNTTDAPADITLYAAAASIGDGEFIGAEGNTANDLSSWTSVDPGTVEVPADGTVTATVTIAVPPDAAPGEQYGVVWAEASSAPSGDGGVTQVSRVGIRLYVSIGPGGAPAADFTIDSLTAGRRAEGEPTVLANVTNTGGRALDLNGTLQLSGGPGGLSAGPFPVAVSRTLALGSSTPVTIVLDPQLPAGPWDATVTLSSGPVERSAQATITFPDAGATETVGAETVESGWLLPALAGLAVLVLLSIVVGLLLLHRHRRLRAPASRRHRSTSTSPSPPREPTTVGRGPAQHP